MECRIRVRGHLDSAWGDRLAGLQVAHEGDGCSLLRGQLADQAALHGVLLHLIRLGLPLLALETRETPARANGREERDAADGGNHAGRIAPALGIRRSSDF